MTARGWLEPSTHPSTIAAETFNADKSAKHIKTAKPHFLLLFRTAAVLGRFAALESKGKLDSAREYFPVSEIKALACALWDNDFGRGIEFHWHLYTAGELSTRFVQAFFTLSPAHADALTEIGRPIAERFCGDHRFESLWELFRLAGDQNLQRNWINGIIGSTGWLWEESTESRRETAKKCIALAVTLGEEELAKATEERICWGRICYSGHKEYSFARPTIWFEKLAKQDSNVIRSTGYRYLSLCEACSALGDNRERWDVNEAIGCAAISAGPDDVFQLLTAEQSDRGADGWLDKVGAQFIAGLTSFLSNNSMSCDDKLFCWSIAVGLSRWYENDDVAALAELRMKMLDTCESSSAATKLLERIKSVTPGDAIRQPVYQSSPGGPSDAKPKDFFHWREKLSESLF